MNTPSDRDARLLEAFFRHAHGLLCEPATGNAAWESARSYLRDRGLELTCLDRFPVGLLPDAATMREGLIAAGFPPDQIKQSGLLADGRLAGRIVGPIRDPRGQIVSFWARHPGGQPPRCLYLSGDWKREVAVFGLDAALPPAAGGGDDILLVEDFCDALLLHVKGYPRAAAIGASGKEMTADRWERLATLGAAEVTLALDDRPLAGQGVLAALDSAARATASPEIFVVPPRPASRPRLSALVRSMPVGDLADLLKKERIHAWRYKALAVLARHRPENSWTESARWAALQEAVGFFTSAHPRNTRQLEAFFVPPILIELGMNDRPPPAAVETAWVAESADGDPEAVEPPPRLPATVASEDGNPVGSANAGPAALKSTPPGFCETHHCDRMNCLCWD
jgi:hypothetical protein